MDQRLSIVTLIVDDLARSRAFYAESLGWQERLPVGEGIAFFQLNGLLLGLYGRKDFAGETPREYAPTPPGSAPTFTMALNLRSTQEVNEMFRELQNAGVDIVKPPEKVFWGGYSGYFADPDGHLWEVAHNPFLEFDQAGNVLPPGQ